MWQLLDYHRYFLALLLTMTGQQTHSLSVNPVVARDYNQQVVIPVDRRTDDSVPHPIHDDLRFEVNFRYGGVESRASSVPLCSMVSGNRRRRDVEVRDNCVVMCDSRVLSVEHVLVRQMANQTGSLIERSSNDRARSSLPSLGPQFHCRKGKKTLL